MVTRWTALALAALAVSLFPASAQGHSLVKCSSRQAPQIQLKCGETNVHHGTTALRFLDSHPKAGNRHTRKSLADSSAFLIRYGNRHTEWAIARMLPPHYSGWNCITNGAHPGAAHEGNGYNGPYTGPLGMTTPWLGNYPPGSDWVHSQVIAVYWIAEKTAARYGFSYQFMKGQWPNTYPPCAGYF